MTTNPLLRYQVATNQRIDSMTVKPTRLHGRWQVIGAGEVQFDLAFPIQFIELPQFYFGGELDKTSVAVTGNYPGVMVTVLQWVNTNQAAGYDGLYVGATLGAIIVGPATQRLWIHWTFDGKALRNPVQAIEGVDDLL